MAKRGEDLWRLGLIVEVGTSLSALQASPLSVLLVPQGTRSPLPSQIDAIAVCKSSTPDTYDFVNDYTSKGCQVKRADLRNCRWPHALVVPSVVAGGSVNLEGEGLAPADLQVKAGSTHPVSPTLLCASPLFLTTYGFVSKERVWFHPTTAVPLERVVLHTTSGLSEKETREVVGQLFQKDTTVILHQGLPLPHFLGGKHLARLTVVETSPVLQGKVTEATTIAVVPPDRSPSPSPKWDRRPRSASALSASDLSHEYSLLSQPTIPRPQDFIIQVVPAPCFKLHSQCIVLPKETAVQQGIFDWQPVQLSRTEPDLEESMEGGARSLSELVIDLEPSPKKPRQHRGLVVLYEDEASLQKYVPAPNLLHRFEGDSLQVGFIDRHLLFTMFPETLAFSRRFHLRISPVSTEEIVSIKEFMVSLVTIPPARSQLTTSQHITALKHFYHDKMIHVQIGDVFPVETDTGTIYYCYHRLEPQSKRVVPNGTINGRSYKNCSVMVNQKQSFVPYVIPPSAVFPHQPFWSHLHPPGLDGFCDTLFSWLVPGLLPPTQRPSCSPSVLLSGPPGVGKRTIVKAVVRRCRLNLMEFNCYEFSSEALGSAEQKLMNNLSNSLVSSPVVVLLTHVHVLGRMQNGKEEPRVATAFETFISDVSVFNQKRDYPVLIVGTTTNPHKVSPQIHACFLHHMDVPSPSQSQRESLLCGLSSEYLMAQGVDWPDFAKRTAGYVLGDFVALFLKASRLALQGVVTYCSERGSDCSLDDLSVAGMVLTHDHLEASLDLLHASHSDAIGAPKIPSVQWEDVGGLAEAKREILDTIQLPLLHPELFTSGLRRSGVLLYGAPGTGKTLLAKAVATECSLNFLSVKGPELINMYVGQSEENVREVFVRARSAAPSVIFFDELDSIAPNRGRSGDSGGVMDRVVSQLLAELDGLQKSEDVFVIGATNRPDLLDQALLRPGRFDRLVYLGVSEDLESKMTVLQAITRRFNLDPSVDLRQLASQCPTNTTGADLYSLCSEAALIALRKQIADLEAEGLSDDDWQGQLVVTEKDFQQAVSSLTPSVSPDELKRYTELGRNHGAAKSSFST